jgi:hypothetical protein
MADVVDRVLVPLKARAAAARERALRRLMIIS